MHGSASADSPSSSREGVYVAPGCEVIQITHSKRGSKTDQSIDDLGFSFLMKADIDVLGLPSDDEEDIILWDEADGLTRLTHDASGTGNRNFVQRNKIGVNPGINGVVANGGHGILLNSGSTNIIGGGTLSDLASSTVSTAGDSLPGNNVSGNHGSGIVVSGTSSAANIIEGNMIGTNATGTDLGNQQYGVEIEGGARLNRVGREDPSGGNTIAHNSKGGIILKTTNVGSPAFNSVLSNSIFSNSGSGIDLATSTDSAAGVTANDNLDKDSGPNSLQNFPVLSSATNSPLRIEGNLRSEPDRGYLIQFFSVPSCDTSLHGQGKWFLGTAAVRTNAQGDAIISVLFPIDATSTDSITTTATADYTGNTSEFSQCQSIAAPTGQSDLQLTASVSTTTRIVGKQLTYSLELTNQGPDQATGVVVQDTLPETVALFSTSSDQGICSSAQTLVTCDLGTLNSGSSTSVTISVVPLKAGAITNQATAAGAQSDLNLANNTATSSVAVSDPVPVVYSISSTNALLSAINPADGSTISSVAITVSEDTVNGGTGLVVNQIDGKLWALLKLASDTSKRELVTIDPATGVATRIGNTGNKFAALAFDDKGALFGLTGDGANLNKDSLFTLNTANASSTYICAFTDPNRGESMAFNPVDGFLYHISGLQAILERVTDTSTNPCSTTNIPLTGYPNEAQALTYWKSQGVFLSSGGKKLHSISAGGVVTELGRLDHTSKGLAFAPAPPPLLAIADLSVAATGGQDLASNLVYTLDVNNAGPSTASSVTLTNLMPSGVNFVSVSTNRGNCAESNGALTCALNDLDAEASAKITLVLNPNMNANFVNTASVHSSTPDPELENNATTTTTLITPATVPTASVPSLSQWGLAILASLLALALLGSIRQARLVESKNSNR
ncbi:MAG: hypothetical protein QF368_15295 [SAR202 cluster bacterium]|nr:hypothetical protein [SAR202 cluster bacterium]